MMFKILFKMACDVLLISITTIAPGLVFSSSSRVIYTYLPSLGVVTVRIFLCERECFLLPME